MLKTYSLAAAFALFSTFSMAQAPQKMTYQSVVRNASGQLVSNASVGVQISILETSPAGVAVFIERHTVTTNLNGLATLEIGGGTLVAGNFSTINWGAGTYFVKTEVDPTGGTVYSIVGTAQLLSVPYALYAATSGSGAPQNLSFSGTDLSISGGNTVNLSTLVNHADAEPTNEIQSLSISGNDLTISGGNTVTLPSGGGANTLGQAYNQGGAGAGRSITTDAGAVQINNAASNTIGLEVNSAVNNSTAVLANVSGIGVGFRVESTSPSNSFAAMQANTNSSSATNSAILGNNSGGGYGVAGQIPASASGGAAVFGNNLRTGGGSGVSGIGFNGVVGQGQYAEGFGVYGVNNSPASGAGTSLGIGTYGLGFNGIYGQTTNTSMGWAGYFTADIGVEGAGYAIGGWINASDARLKTNITPIASALERIMKVEGLHYTITVKTHNANGEVTQIARQQYGVLAQELEKYFPEMVQEKAIFSNMGDQTLYKTVEYTQLIPVLIEAIKELKAEVDALKAVQNK